MAIESLSRLRLLVAGSLLTAILTAHAQQETVLRIGAGHPTPGATYVLAHDTYFVPEVTRRAKEKGMTVRFTKAWAGTVAKPDGVVEATQKGSLDIGLVMPIFEPTRMALLNYGVFTPFGSSDQALVTRSAMRLIKDIPAINDSLRPYNVQLLAMASSENYGMTSRVEIDKLEDLRGRKYATGAVNTVWTIAAGATPIVVPTQDNYQAIQTGMIDGNLYPISGMTAFKFHEVAKYYYKVGLGSFPAFATVMNLDTRKRLPPELVTIIDQVAEDTALEIARIARQRDTDSEAGARAANVQVLVFPERERQRWAEGLKDLPGKTARELDAKGQPGTQVFKAYIQHLRDGGYRFPIDYPL